MQRWRFISNCNCFKQKSKRCNSILKFNTKSIQLYCKRFISIDNMFSERCFRCGLNQDSSQNCWFSSTIIYCFKDNVIRHLDLRNIKFYWQDSFWYFFKAELNHFVYMPDLLRGASRKKKQSADFTRDYLGPNTAD